MEPLIMKFAVLTRKTQLRLHLNIEVSPNQFKESELLNADAGTLMKVYQTKLLGVNGFPNRCTVKILDFVEANPIYENLYECSQSNLRKISEDMLQYVINILEPERRLDLLKNEEICRMILNLKINAITYVSGDIFGKSVNYLCIIRYIGPVQELYPVGYFFGLELLNLDNGHSPQSKDISFVKKYMECKPSLAFIVTADRICFPSSENKKKFSPIELISGTLDKVRTAIAPNNNVNGNTNTTLRGVKRPKKKEATAQFYDISTLEDNSKSQAEETIKVINSVAEVDKNRNNLPHAVMEHTSSQTPTNVDTERIIKTQPIPTDSSENFIKNLISIGNEEFGESVENYEKNLERQYANNIDIVNTLNIPGTQTAPVGILKKKETGAGTSKSIPSTIMSLEDRDIVVIDKADIHESTKNESNVIVVDKLHKQEVDLVELLGNNWPNTAGDAGSILNKSQKQIHQDRQKLHSVTQSQKDRNKLYSTTAGSQDRSNQRTISPDPISSITADNNLKIKENNYYTNVRTSLYDNLIDTDVSDGAEEPITSLKAQNNDFEQNSTLQEVPGTGFGVGSMVEVSVKELSDDLYGVIRWIGIPPGRDIIMVGIELEDDHSNNQVHATDGTFNGVRLFKCHEGRALLVTPNQCKIDKRFIESDCVVATKPNAANAQLDSNMFGQVMCPSVPGSVPPIKVFNLEQLEQKCGKFRGIQGHHNSCYLDATLFAMFTFTTVFDSLLFRPPEQEDIADYGKVQKVLREEIVNPLRKNVFVRADRVMKLRQLLDKLSSVSGLTSEEKDPEEFLNSLLAQIMRVEPFLKLNSGQDAYFYQLFVEKDERLSFPTVQQLFEQSFHSSEIKLKEVPSCLIIQMPRFGKNYKMYPRILPSEVLDVTDIIEDSPRQCSVCGKLADSECRDCFGSIQGGVGLECTAYCRKCLEKVHMHSKRVNHTSKPLSVPQDFRIMAEHMNVPRLYMELFAVVCIETSHYVAFVKSGSGPDAPWCFFDSMADRKGEQNGYNIPEMITVPDLPQWLSEDGARVINETSSNDKMLPEHAKRLFCDAYMCMYQSSDVMMYR